MSDKTEDTELRTQISNLMADLMVETKLIQLADKEGMLKQGLELIQAHNKRLDIILALIKSENSKSILEVLDRIEKQSELGWYLRNEDIDECNPQESGEANVARIVTDAIEQERNKLGVNNEPTR